MAVSDEKWSIEKLDGSNWQTWKFQLYHLLEGKNLWRHVEGTAVLAGEADDQAREEFEQKSKRAFSTLVMMIAPSQLYLITSCTTPSQAWSALKKHFERESLANKLFLKKQYF